MNYQRNDIEFEEEISDSFSDEDSEQSDFIDEIDIKNKTIKVALFNNGYHEVFSTVFNYHPWNTTETTHDGWGNEYEVSRNFYLGEIIGRSPKDFENIEERIETLLNSYFEKNLYEFQKLQEDKSFAVIEGEKFSLHLKETRFGFYTEIKAGHEEDSVFYGTHSECNKLKPIANSLCLLVKNHSQKVTRESISKVIQHFFSTYQSIAWSSIVDVEKAYVNLLVFDKLNEKLQVLFKDEIHEYINQGHKLDYFSLIEGKVQRFDLMRFQSENPQIYEKYQQIFDIKKFKSENPSLYSKYITKEPQTKLINSFKSNSDKPIDFEKILDEINDLIVSN